MTLQNRGKPDISLTNLEEVVIPDVEYKFVLVEVSCEGPETRKIVRIDALEESHYNIVFSLVRRELGGRNSGFKVLCLGGGRLRISIKEKTIHLFGLSKEYGREPNRKETTAILKKTFPDFVVTYSEV